MLLVKDTCTLRVAIIGFQLHFYSMIAKVKESWVSYTAIRDAVLRLFTAIPVNPYFWIATLTINELLHSQNTKSRQYYRVLVYLA